MSLATAYKRGMHFGAGIADGPFCSLHSPIGKNYAMALRDDATADELTVFDQWAAGLNRLADTRQVSANLPLREAFASFVSLLWIDPRKL